MTLSDENVSAVCERCGGPGWVGSHGEGYCKTERGFKHYEPIETDYGHKLLVHESSAAMRPCLWLRIDDDEISNGDSLAIHLTFEQAKALRKALKRAMRGHYQR